MSIFSINPQGAVAKALPIVLLAGGVFFPSSVHGNILTGLWVAQLLCLALLLLALVFADGVEEPRLLIFALLVPACLLIGTLVSRLSEYHLGAILPFTVVAILYVTPLRQLRAGRETPYVLLLVNLVILGLGGALVMGFDPVRNWVLNYYSAFYPELVETMTAAGKPVVTFGTHSFAAFFYYLFFWLSLETYRMRLRHGWVFLVCAFAYVPLMLFLWSVSGLIFAAVAAVQLTWRLMRAGGAGRVVALTLVLIAAMTVPWGLLRESGKVVLQSETSGFLGRYSSGSGNLRLALAYIGDHPFAPIGLTHTDTLQVGDSGPVEYMLRGSVFLLTFMYAGLWFFLRANLHARRDRYFLFAVVLCIELGLTVLPNVRFLYLLPFVVIYLNFLGDPQATLVRIDGHVC